MISEDYEALKFIGNHYAILITAEAKKDGSKDLLLYNTKTNNINYIGNAKYFDYDIQLFGSGAIINLSRGGEGRYIIVKVDPEVSIETRTTGFIYDFMAYLPI
jgi:hypothetical protein